jgi:hypothetical protein
VLIIEEMDIISNSLLFKPIPEVLFKPDFQPIPNLFFHTQIINSLSRQKKKKKKKPSTIKIWNLSDLLGDEKVYQALEDPESGELNFWLKGHSI